MFETCKLVTLKDRYTICMWEKWHVCLFKTLFNISLASHTCSFCRVKWVCIVSLFLLCFVWCLMMMCSWTNFSFVFFFCFCSLQMNPMTQLYYKKVSPTLTFSLTSANFCQTRWMFSSGCVVTDFWSVFLPQTNAHRCVWQMTPALVTQRRETSHFFW